MDWSNWKLDTEIWGNTVIAYLVALATILVVALIVWSGLRLVGRRLHKVNRERNLQVFLLVKGLESTRLGLMLIVVGALVLQNLD